MSRPKEITHFESTDSEAGKNCTTTSRHKTTVSFQDRFFFLSLLLSIATMVASVVVVTVCLSASIQMLTLSRVYTVHIENFIWNFPISDRTQNIKRPPRLWLSLYRFVIVIRDNSPSLIDARFIPHEEGFSPLPTNEINNVTRKSSRFLRSAKKRKMIIRETLCVLVSLFLFLLLLSVYSVGGKFNCVTSSSAIAGIPGKK